MVNGPLARNEDHEKSSFGVCATAIFFIARTYHLDTAMAPTAVDQALFAGSGAAPPPTKTTAAAAPSNNTSRIQPDPQLVQYPTSWPANPTTASGWFERAHEVSELLAQDAHIRDRGNVVPYRQVQLLKDSGLSGLLGRVEWGGAGQTWEVAYKCVAIVAEGEGSLGQLLGYHLICE